MSVSEIDEVIGSIGICLGQRLQSVSLDEQDVVLGFRAAGRTIWLWLDLHPNAPALLPMIELPLAPAAKRSPMLLFLKAHFVGQELKSIERLSGLGRVVTFTFENQGVLEFRMIPRAANLIAGASGKRVSLKPIQDLPPSQDAPGSKPRPLMDLVNEWKSSRLTPRRQKTPKEVLEKKLQSAYRSLEKVQSEIQKKSSSEWRQLGDWLVAHQSLEVPEEFAAMIDRRRKLAWNIEECFHKAKESERKLQGTRSRAAEIKAEIADLERRLAQGDWLPEKGAGASTKSPRPPSRTLHLADNLQVVAGKSAQDNMALLRRAHAWDLWLHVKDQPSAHAILFRPRGMKISDEMLRRASQWLLRMSLGPKFKSYAGEKFEILSAECRYVSPIKGDRLGRVTFRNEKVFTIRFDPS